MDRDKLEQELLELLKDVREELEEDLIVLPQQVDLGRYWEA